MTTKNNSISKQSVESFIKDIASGSPTPGGGAVAAITGSTAAALVEMVCNLTKDNKIESINHRAREIKIKLLKLADEDCRAFESVMESYRLKDKEKIKRALKRAMEVPMEVKKLVEELQKMAITISKFGNKNAISDAKTAIYLCSAAGKSAWENVKINKASLANL